MRRDFVQVMKQADALLLTEVYSAGEAPIPAADGRALARALRLAGREPLFVPEMADMPAALQQLVRGGDVVIGLGAGSMSQFPKRVAEQFQP